jgi:hypothetical protein
VKCNKDFKFDDFIDNSVHECLADDPSISRNYMTYMKEDFSSQTGAEVRKPKDKDDAIGLSDLESSNLIIPEV